MISENTQWVNPIRGLKLQWTNVVVEHQQLGGRREQSTTVLLLHYCMYK